MASRSFEDSSGILWEVFEVTRSSATAGGVSRGLEQGWLTFQSSTEKRRLAPFPSGWQDAEVTELERLCANARAANPPRFSEARPRIKPARSAPVEVPTPQPAAPGDEPRLVRDVVRAFAQQARRDSTPAIEAMVRLKALLAEKYETSAQDESTKSDLSDLRRIRRWFVEAFYFERPA